MAIAPIPMQLHSHVPDGPLGGCRWTRDALKRFGDIHMSAAEERDHNIRKRWWTASEAESLIAGAFPDDAVYAVLGVRWYGLSWLDAADEVNHTAPWVRRYDRRMKHYVLDALQLL